MFPSPLRGEKRWDLLVSQAVARPLQDVLSLGFMSLPVDGLFMTVM